MEPPASLVTKARTAFNSAAAKAERVLTDFKSDLIIDRDSDKQRSSDTKKQSEPKYAKNEVQWHHESKQLRWGPSNVVAKQDWQDKFKNISRGRKGAEESESSAMAIPFLNENVYQMSMKNALESKGSETISSTQISDVSNNDFVPPTAIIKQLSVAVEAGKKLKSMKDLLASSGNTSPVRERASLSLSAMKSLVLRDKEDKLTPEFGCDDKVQSLVHSLFVTESQFSRKKVGFGSETFTSAASLSRDIHAAPPGSFVVKLAEVIGSFKTLRKMAICWCQVVDELQRLWSEGQHVPGIPLDEVPDLNSCLLYQQLQVINGCLSRRRRRVIAAESLDSVLRESSSNVEESVSSESPILYARVSSGELVLRIGVDHITRNLKLLETGEPVCSPVTQEVPLLTEDLIRETEEFVLRTGSVGAGCSQLFSDMQAFKAANPGCILEDFVRWHSPPDWTEAEQSSESKDTFDVGVGDLSAARGQLSNRMQKEGNLWQELWGTAKPVPAVKQTPLYDEDLAVEGILNDLEDIQPSVLFEQLFISLLALCLMVAETMVSADDALSKLFYECKDYVVATCQSSNWIERVEDLCQVYKTVEMMLLNPQELLKTVKQPEETASCTDEPRSRFRRLSLNFGSKKPASKDQKNQEENPPPPRQTFASFFDGKSSLFSKKPPKPETVPPSQVDETLRPGDSDWTVV